jgi:hypothetical protein
MISDEQLSTRARRLSAALEPSIGGVIFAPEAHAEYEALGFGASPGVVAGVARPDGPAYFGSRGSLLGQAPGELVAAAFAVFNPAIVVPCVDMAWGLTDAVTIHAARERGGRAQLARILGDPPDGVDRVVELLARATAVLRPEGRPLYAGASSYPVPDDALAAVFFHGDLLREYRGDSHTASWISAGFDAVESGLMAELYLGIGLRTYVRSRVWSDEDLDAGVDRLTQRGLIDGDAFTDAGRAAREAIEVATDAQMRPAIEAIGDDLDELVSILEPWAVAIRAAGGYLGSPADLAP